MSAKPTVFRLVSSPLIALVVLLGAASVTGCAAEFGEGEEVVDDVVQSSNGEDAFATPFNVETAQTRTDVGATDTPDAPPRSHATRVVDIACKTKLDGTSCDRAGESTSVAY